MPRWFAVVGRDAALAGWRGAWDATLVCFCGRGAPLMPRWVALGVGMPRQVALGGWDIMLVFLGSALGALCWLGFLPGQHCPALQIDLVPPMVLSALKFIGCNDICLP